MHSSRGEMTVGAWPGALITIGVMLLTLLTSAGQASTTAQVAPTWDPLPTVLHASSALLAKLDPRIVTTTPRTSPLATAR